MKQVKLNQIAGNPTDLYNITVDGINAFISPWVYQYSSYSTSIRNIITKNKFISPSFFKNEKMNIKSTSGWLNFSQNTDFFNPLSVGGAFFQPFSIASIINSYYRQYYDLIHICFPEYYQSGNKKYYKLYNYVNGFGQYYAATNGVSLNNNAYIYGVFDAENLISNGLTYQYYMINNIASTRKAYVEEEYRKNLFTMGASLNIKQAEEQLNTTVQNGLLSSHQNNTNSCIVFPISDQPSNITYQSDITVDFNYMTFMLRDEWLVNYNYDIHLLNDNHAVTGLTTQYRIKDIWYNYDGRNASQYLCPSTYISNLATQYDYTTDNFLSASLSLQVYNLKNSNNQIAGKFVKLDDNAYIQFKYANGKIYQNYSFYNMVGKYIQIIKSESTGKYTLIPQNKAYYSLTFGYWEGSSISNLEYVKNKEDDVECLDLSLQISENQYATFTQINDNLLFGKINSDYYYYNNFYGQNINQYNSASGLYVAIDPQSYTIAF